MRMRELIDSIQIVKDRQSYKKKNTCAGQCDHNAMAAFNQSRIIMPRLKQCCSSRRLPRQLEVPARSRSIEAARRRAPKRTFLDKLKLIFIIPEPVLLK